MILGADSRGQFRDEDRLCAARIARTLVAAGFTPTDRLTNEVESIHPVPQLIDLSDGRNRSA